MRESDKALRLQKGKLAWHPFIYPFTQSPVRLLVLGLPASGKTSLATVLEERFGHPHIEADILWKGDTANLREAVASATESDSWIYEGHFSKTADILLPRITGVLWLDIPFPKLFFRLLRRNLSQKGVLPALTQKNSHLRYVLRNWYSLQQKQLEALSWVIDHGIPLIRLN